MSRLNRVSYCSLEIAAFEELVYALTNAGISISKAGKGALAFFVRANNEKYGHQCSEVIKKLIEEMNSLALQENGARKITRKLDHEVTQLFKEKLKNLSSSDQSLVASLDAIMGLYEACKMENKTKSEIGPINFGGIPAVFIPGWYKELNS